MATTYTSARVALTEIAQRSDANRKRLDQAKATISAADADLGAMPTAYGTIVTDINAAAAAAPGDAALQALKAEKDKLVADFQALKTEAAALKTAVGG